jgi:hypothetical protein
MSASVPIAAPPEGVAGAGPEPPVSAEPLSSAGAEAGLGADRRAYVWCLGTLAVVYLVVYGWLLASTNLLPYVYDNNETFSSLWHAHNLYSYDLFRSRGLTDEAFSPHAPAHPYAHTHQGNFPRLPAFVIYVLGARTAESQILVTTFTAGVVAMFFAFHFLARRAGPYFALTATLVLITDYLFYTQWHVVTYRVWHLFFVFSSLLCIDGIGRSAGRQRTLWLLLTFINFAGLFYFELVFVAFTAMLAGMYALWSYWRRPRTLLLAWIAEGLGGLCGVGVLILQLRMYLGWAALFEDFYLTFFTRNRVADDPAMLQQIESFYQDRNIAFWFNVVDVGDLRSLSAFVHQVFEYHLGVLTPFLTLVVLVVVGGWLLGALPWPRPAVQYRRGPTGDVLRGGGRMETPLGSLGLTLAVRPRAGTVGGRLARWLAGRPGQIVRAALTIFVILGPFALLVATILRDEAFLGLPRSGELQAWFTGGLGRTGLVILIASALEAVLIAVIATPFVNRLSVGRALLAGLFLLVLTRFISTQSTLYDQQYAPIWFERLGLWAPWWLDAAMMLLAAGLATALILLGTRRLLGADASANVLGIVPYLLLASVALFVTFMLSPGYVVSGYIRRGAPLLVFVVDIVVAVGLYVPLILGVRGLRVAMRALRPTEPPSGRRSVAGSLVRAASGVAMLALFIFCVGFWLNMQATYLALLPPNHFAFLKMLAQPPYRGASFTLNTYAAPTAAYTDQWAYMDTTLAQARIALTDNGFTVAQELQSYLWLADRRTNPAYRRPDYYLCMRYQSLADALYRIRGAESRDGACSDVPIVQRADSPNQPYLHYQVVTRDASPFDGWAIVKLDWDFPPYLKRLPDGDGQAQVTVEIVPGSGGSALDVRYQYAQQDGQPEQGTVLRLYGLAADRSRCLLAEQPGPGRLMVPPGLSGTVQVSVQPATATKRGDESFSDDVVVGVPGGQQTSC